MTATKSRADEVQADNQLLAGIQKHYPSTTFSTRSGPVTVARIEAMWNTSVSHVQVIPLSSELV